MQFPKGFTPCDHEHAVLAQYHRWFQFYESEIDLTERKVENQLSLLQEDVHVINRAYNSEVVGHSAYLSRMPPLLGWKNSHRVLKTDVKPVFGGYELRATIVYTNIKPDNTSATVQIQYECLLLEKGLSSGILPKFHFVTLASYSPLPSVPFHDQYTENRAKSFMHYWLFLMENPGMPADRFDDLLDNKGFHLDMSTQQITSKEGMQAWAKSTATRVAKGAHKVLEFSSAKLDANHIGVNAAFSWTGVSVDGKFI